MENSSIYVLTEDLTRPVEDVLSIVGVRGVVTLDTEAGDPRFHYLIGATQGRVDATWLRRACGGIRQTFFERENVWIGDKIMHKHPNPLEPVNPDDPNTWGLRSFAFLPEIPTVDFVEAATPCYGGAFVQFKVQTLDHLPEEARQFVVREYAYDDTEALVTA